MKFLHFFYFFLLLLFSQLSVSAPNISIAFVLDESGSVTSNNFKLETKGFINALNGLPTDGSVEVSIIGFSSGSEILQSPTILTSSSINDIISALENNRQANNGTNMSAAIDASVDLLLSSSSATKITCLATDGEPNSKFSAQSAASTAKDAGIIISPIGIGLNESRKSFLDSIASNPPVPNPSSFTEFATVVRNDCIGVVESALNIQLEPDIVDFGIFNTSSIGEDLKVCADKPQFIGILNKSNQPAQITNIEIIGQDAENYRIESFMGVDASQLTYPIRLSPLFSSQIAVRLVPNKSPMDGSYDATVKITAQDQNGVQGTFATDLFARVSPDIPSCVGVTPIDGASVIQGIRDDGNPIHFRITPNAILAEPVTEDHITTAIEEDFNDTLRRTGMVTDGNSRILLVAKTRQSSGKIRFEITNPNVTEARLYGLGFSPTYIPETDSNTARVYDTNGKTIIDLDIETNSDGFGQVTAILRAGERFLGTGEFTKFEIKTCILEGDTCSKIEDKISLQEHRTPVVLIHGLWANNESWRDDDNNDHGLLPELKRNNFIVSLHSYDGNLGPVDTVPETGEELVKKIEDICNNINEKKIACTRTDIVAHSMGGLFTREFARQNLHNSGTMARLSYGQGTIRRFITLGTPHLGSPLANILLAWNLFNDDNNSNLIANNKYINDCIEESSFFNPSGGYDEIEDLVNNLASDDKLIQSGVSNLAVGSYFLDTLNSNVTNNIKTYALAGNIGNNYDQSLIVGDVFFGRTYRFHTIGNVEKAGCNYNDVMANNNAENSESDGIVPIDSARYLSSFSEKYKFDTTIPNYNFLNHSNSELIGSEDNGINHTNMGKLHSRLNDNREEDVSHEERRVIDRVINLLNSPLDGVNFNFSGKI